MAEELTSCRTKRRPADQKQDLINRLRRAEGQLHGILGMVERDAYCVDILTQVSAVTCALNSFAGKLLESHIRTCVAEDIRQGGADKLEELLGTLQKMLK